MTASRATSASVRMLHDLTAGEVDLHTLAKRHSVSLDRLSRWTLCRRTAGAISRIREVEELRAALLISAARANAAAVLYRSVSDTQEPPDRRACIDLLKLAPTAPPPAQPSAADLRAARQALDPSSDA